MRTLYLLWFAFAGCGGDVDLTGDWSGNVTCGGFSMPFTLSLADGNDPGEFDGSGLVAFTDADDEEVELTFDAALELGETTGDSVTVNVDLDNCAEKSFGSTQCWAGGATYDTVDEELTGDFVGFPVNDGNCSWQLEQ